MTLDFRSMPPPEDWDRFHHLLRRRMPRAPDMGEASGFGMGDAFSVADAYAFTVLGWTKHVGIDLSGYPAIGAYLARIAARPAVQKTLQAEGLA